MDHHEGQTHSAGRSLKRKLEPGFQDQTRASKVLAVEDPDKKGSITAFKLNSSTTTTSFSGSHRDYDIFLSFRGEDTRKNFTDHLYNALVRIGIHTFRDEEELQRGTTISAEILSAIRRSKISIVVFSKDYASSSWCLDELVEILRCRKTMGHTLLPIFYNVDPSDVRKQNGSFAEAFVRLEQHFQAKMEKVQRWREALTEAANCFGWDLHGLANGYESSFIEKIVVEVSHMRKLEELKVAKQPVGINYRVDKVVGLLNLGTKDVRMVGIYGVAGIGKTTIAKAVYNQICYGFEGSSCLLHIKESSKQPKGSFRLQKQLLYDILKIKDLKIANVDQGLKLIENRIYGKKVLIVLDDVDDPKQLYELLGSSKMFGLGSRIIATTRDEVILTNLGVHAKYKVKKLGEEESLQLFNLNAFATSYSKEDFKELSLDAMRYCGGLPLALEVLGSFLMGQSVVNWKMELEKLQRNPNPKIQRVLRISFESLDDTAKKIFLDISCFFVGKDKDYVLKILDGCDFYLESGINTLIQRSLVTIDKKRKLKMHDLIRDMGRRIVQEESLDYPEKRSRLWYYKDILKVLYNHTGTETMEGIISNFSIFENEHLDTKAFTNMKRLRLLQINGVHLIGSFEYLSKELKLLCWPKCPLTFLPQNFHLENLVILDMKHSNIQEVWKNNKKLSKLKILNLEGCKHLKKTPNFSQVPHLEILILEGCISLVQVHESIGDLGRLVLLNLKGCENLCNFPSIILNLKSLEILNFSGCLKFKRLPEDLGNMIALKELHVDDTAIKQLPSSIVLLKSLKILNLSRQRGEQSSKSFLARYCPWFAYWPIDVTAFGMSLFSSWMSPKRSKPVSLLPASVSGLCSLKWLNLSGRNLSEDDFPSDFGSLCSLQELKLSRNNFRIPPHCISHLPNLFNLDLNECTTIQSISGVPRSNWSISRNACTSLERILITPNLGRKLLILHNCLKLTEFQSLERQECSLSIYLDQHNNLPFNFWSQVQCASTLGDDRCRNILSTCHAELPNWFSHQSNGGNSISFHVPLISEVQILRLLVCVVYKSASLFHRGDCLIIRNESRGHKHMYNFNYITCKSFKDGRAVLLYQTRPISNVLEIETGDKIEVSTRFDKAVEIKKWGVNILVVKPNPNEEHETTTVDGRSDASASQG